MTQPPTPAAPTRGRPRPLRTSAPWGIPFAAVSIVVLTFIAVVALLPAKLVADKPVEDADGEVADVETPYALVPAAAQPVAERVSYGDLADDISVDTDLDGRVFFVTVSEPAQSLLGYWAGAAVAPTWLRGLVGDPEPEVQFTTYEEKYGSQTPSEQRRVSLQMMYDSSQVAQYVALTRSGYDAEIIPRILVQSGSCAQVSEDGQRCAEESPLREELQIGDEIFDVDGQRVGTGAEVGAALADRRPGDVVEVTIRRDNEERTLELALVEHPNDPERAIIGFLPFETASVELPFEIEIDTGQIGGPSAGLAFTLTLIDELTDGDLLGGADMAVTGTMSLDGSVGPIGGLPQKVSAVRQAGIDYFIVPAGQTDLEAALEIAVDDVELVPVASIDEALAALDELGGDPLSD